MIITSVTVTITGLFISRTLPEKILNMQETKDFRQAVIS